jgi:hypothetical protein
MEQRDDEMKRSRDETLVGHPRHWGIGVVAAEEIFWSNSILYLIANMYVPSHIAPHHLKSQL